MSETTISKLSAHARSVIDEWLKKYPADQKKSAVLAALREVQHENKGYLTVVLMDAVADYLGMARIAVYEVASFYSMLETKPCGRNSISVCTNISCMLCGADEIVARATAKDPAERQADVSVLLYELRTLMTMLGVEKPRRRAPGGDGPSPAARRPDRSAAAGAEVFEAAPLPLACCDTDGSVRVANRAFLEFLGVAGNAGGINLADSGFCDVYPALLDDLRLVIARRRAIKRIVYLSEGGGHVVQVAVVLSPAPADAPVTAGEIHIALHPLARQQI